VTTLAESPEDARRVLGTTTSRGTWRRPWPATVAASGTGTRARAVAHAGAGPHCSGVGRGGVGKVLVAVSAALPASRSSALAMCTQQRWRRWSRSNS
jgi:hypothetical protein